MRPWARVVSRKGVERGNGRVRLICIEIILKRVADSVTAVIRYSELQIDRTKL